MQHHLWDKVCNHSSNYLSTPTNVSIYYQVVCTRLNRVFERINLPLTPVLPSPTLSVDWDPA
jgi:hypothetical protein